MQTCNLPKLEELTIQTLMQNRFSNMQVFAQINESHTNKNNNKAKPSKTKKAIGLNTSG